MREREKRRPITVLVSRPEIEVQDPSGFLNRFGRERLPTGDALAALMGVMEFQTYGYEADHRELYEIPEVRRYFQTLDQAWPFWLYFGDLRRDTFGIVALSCLESTEPQAPDGKGRTSAAFEPMELLHWLSERFSPMNELCANAGLSDKTVIARTDALFRYFGLPVDHK